MNFLDLLIAAALYAAPFALITLGTVALVLGASTGRADL